MAVLVMSTDAGDFAIQEDEVSTITAAELCQLRISRVDLRRLFAEAAKLLLGIKPRDQARLVATRATDGYWEVHAHSLRNSRARSLDKARRIFFGRAVGLHAVRWTVAVAADRCRRQTVKENLSPYFGSSVFSRGSSFFRETDPAWPSYPGSNLACHFALAARNVLSPFAAEESSGAAHEKRLRLPHLLDETRHHSSLIARISWSITACRMTPSCWLVNCEHALHFKL